MTEKKKRGRPRKIKTNAEDRQATKDCMTLSEKSLAKDWVSAPDEDDMGLKFGNVIPVQAQKPYPDNWASMGKVDRLAWLTANPR